jgi:hypothetical protein
VKHVIGVLPILMSLDYQLIMILGK